MTFHRPLPGPPAILHRPVVAACHEVVKGQDLGAAVCEGRGGGLENFSGPRMQFAASLVGQAGVRNLPKNRVTETKPVILRHDQALQSGKQFGYRSLG